MNRFRYIPHTETDIRQMLTDIGVSQVKDLFRQIPADCLLHDDAEHTWFFDETDEEAPRSSLNEAELLNRFRALAERSTPQEESFIGAGYYPHHIPAAVKQILLRSEFYTAYTPYQPEIAQGTLQAIFEYQTLICQITGCEISNASLYNGASAMAEAALMACRVTGKDHILVHEALHPHYRQVLETVLSQVATIESVPFDPETGTTDPQTLTQYFKENTAGLIIQNPNFFGCVEDVRGLASFTHDHNALLIDVITEPLSLGLLEAPGRLGADIVVGEGGSLGLPLNYGGPGVGFLATSKKFLRNLPGRLCSETVDQEGRRGFVLTLATREQHIRRQKATSNICTNQSLCALAFAIKLSLLGKSGFRQLALINLSKLDYLTQRLDERKIRPIFSGACFNERVFGPFKKPASGVLQDLQVRGLVPGLPLGDFFPESADFKKAMLICTTEEHSKGHIDKLVAGLAKVNR